MYSNIYVSFLIFIFLLFLYLFYLIVLHRPICLVKCLSPCVFLLAAREDAAAFRVREGPRRRGRLFARTRRRRVGQGRGAKQSASRGRGKQTDPGRANVIGSGQPHEHRE